MMQLKGGCARPLGTSENRNPGILAANNMFSHRLWPEFSETLRRADTLGELELEARNAALSVSSNRRFIGRELKVCL